MLQGIPRRDTTARDVDEARVIPRDRQEPIRMEVIGCDRQVVAGAIGDPNRHDPTAVEVLRRLRDEAEHSNCTKFSIRTNV
jgi:hypothetical protein